jgi:hypothetical protein
MSRIQAFCLLNHQLTENQIAELKKDFTVKDIIYPPQDVSLLWRSIPPDVDITKELLEPFTSWLKAAKPGDILVVQGEFGSTFALVDFALKTRLVPIHSTTKRIASETRDGEIVRRSYIFQHVRFRRYEYFRGGGGR